MALERELAGRYSIEGLLGRGSMGSVFRARHLALARDVAIKVLTGHADTHAAERMVREARISARIQSPADRAAPPRLLAARRRVEAVRGRPARHESPGPARRPAHPLSAGPARRIP